MTHRHNFSPGPGILPASVIAQIRHDLPDYADTGISILEMSHRTPVFEALIEEAEANLRELLAIPRGYRVLFLQGGASLQFGMVPYNFLPADGVADYLAGGTWGKKAVEDARRCGRVAVRFDGAAVGYRRLPKWSELELTPGAAYLHATSNETIEGVEIHDDPPALGLPIICDASSDFLARPLDVSRYAMLYAGAQKNAGAAGVTLAILSEELLARALPDRLALMSYAVHAQSRSLYNTPPCFSVYVVTLVTRWLKDTVGGLAAMQVVNRRKAQALYETLDASSFYRAHADVDSRSVMNVTFRLPSAELEQRFAAESEAAGFIGLRGHRAFGGLRASLYNALPESSVTALVEFMREFERRA